MAIVAAFGKNGFQATFLRLRVRGFEPGEIARKTGNGSCFSMIPASMGPSTGPRTILSYGVGCFSSFATMRGNKKSSDPAQPVTACSVADR